MAYIQKPGGPIRQKTGHGIAPLMQKVAGTEANQDQYKSFFKEAGEKAAAMSFPKTDFSTKGYLDKQAADQKLRDPFGPDYLRAQEYDKLVANNDLSIKLSPENLKYAKGKAKAADTSAEVMTLKQNQGQLPGEKGFKGGTSERGTVIFPTVKGDKVSGEIPKNMQWNQGPDEEYAGNTNKQYWKSDKPGALGKLETLATGFTGGGKTPKTSESVTTESFGYMDQFNQTMGGIQNPARVGRDKSEYANTLMARATGSDTIKQPANTLSDSGTRQDAESAEKSMDWRTSGDKNLDFKKAKSFQGQSGQEALRNNDTATLLALATSGVKKDEDAIGYLQANIGKSANLDAKGNPIASKGGYESTTAQKYDYPTQINYSPKINEKGENEGQYNTYSGPNAGQAYFSPEMTMKQNEAVSNTADYNRSLKDFLTKGKYYNEDKARQEQMKNSKLFNR